MEEEVNILKDFILIFFKCFFLSEQNFNNFFSFVSVEGSYGQGGWGNQNYSGYGYGQGYGGYDGYGSGGYDYYGGGYGSGYGGYDYSGYGNYGKYQQNTNQSQRNNR